MGTGNGEKPEYPETLGDRPNARSYSVWRWQLILAASAVAVAAVIAFLIPEYFTNPLYVAGMTLLLVLTLAALAVPWHRVGAAGVLVLPFLDIVAIGLMASSGDNRLGFLWVFPITWIGTYYTYVALTGALVTVAGMLMLPLVSSQFSSAQTLRLLVVIICLSFIGTTIISGANRTRASAHLLQRQSRQLRQTIERVSVQKHRSAALLDGLQSGVAQIDEAGRLRATNSAYRRLYGLEGLPQHHPTRAVEYRSRRGEPVPLEETTVARAARGETFESQRVWLFDTTGEWRALDVTAKRIDPHADHASDIMVVVDDVTEQTNATNERHSMARIISHELRNPLTAIVGHSDLLMEREDVSEPVREQLSVIDHAATRMEQMIDNILDESAASASDCDTNLDLEPVIAASVEAFAPAAAAAGVALSHQAEGPLPLIGDAFRLRQVVDNVISNAIKYTPRSGRVDVSARVADDSDVEITVADTGIGIAQTDLPHIFDRYFRAESARANALPGTGLGMAISRDIVKEHDGTLDISSDLGRGTRVLIRLAGVKKAGNRMVRSDAA